MTLQELVSNQYWTCDLYNISLLLTLSFMVRICFWDSESLHGEAGKET